MQRDIRKSRRLKSSFLREALKQAVAMAPVSGDVSASLIITSDEIIHELNKRDRGVDRPTDVLSYSMIEDGEIVTFPGEPYLLGEIVISLDTAKRQAQETGISLHHMVAWLVAHGVMHLSGLDHPNDQELAEMRALELKVLRRLGFAVLPHFDPTANDGPSCE